jgi:hypothetical protein
MSALNASSSFEMYRSAPSGRDASWYGTLGVLAACLCALLVGLAG